LFLVQCSEYKQATVLLGKADVSSARFDETKIKGIPNLAYLLKRTMVGEVHYWWGVDAITTVFFSQVHQESNWNPEAKSKYASGLAQFTSSTAEWISKLYPKDLGENNPLDVKWALRALVKYDKFLYDRASYAEGWDNRWRFTLSGYNGGEGWVKRDRKLCFESLCCDQNKWIGNVELYSSRADWAIKENRDYPVKILDRWLPMYKQGGF
jgi:membrane-bound lytic murein transglycosylase MltF